MSSDEGATYFTFRESLKNLIDLLDESLYIRVHQSHLINVEHLKSINTEENYVIMSSQAKIPVSRRKRKELEELWQSYG